MNEYAEAQMSGASAPRVLAYDRVDQNKRQARLLILAFAVIMLPAALFLAVYLTFLFAVLVGMTFGILTAGGTLTGDGWIAWALAVPVVAAILALLTPVVIFWRAVDLVLRLSGARQLEEGEHPELRRTVENLCIGSGLPRPRLYLVNANAPNAFSTGMSPDTSSLAVTRGLLGALERRELEGVVAHELVQIGNYDTRVSTILAAGVAFLRLPFTVVTSVFRFLFRLHWVIGVVVFLWLGLPFLISVPMGFVAGISLLDDDPWQGVIVLVTMSIPVYAFIVAPLLGEALRAAVSRQQQFRADADAVLLARSAEPLATALVKMDAAGIGDLNAARSTAHLWTVDPLPDRPWWESLWPDYHPPVTERVEMLAGMGAGIPPSVLEAAADAGRSYRSAVAAVAEPSVVATAPSASTSADEIVAAEAEAYRLTGV